MGLLAPQVIPVRKGTQVQAAAIVGILVCKVTLVQQVHRVIPAWQAILGPGLKEIQARQVVRATREQLVILVQPVILVLVHRVIPELQEIKAILEYLVIPVLGHRETPVRRAHKVTQAAKGILGLVRKGIRALRETKEIQGQLVTLGRERRATPVQPAVKAVRGIQELQAHRATKGIPVFRATPGQAPQAIQVHLAIKAILERREIPARVRQVIQEQLVAKETLALQVARVIRVILERLVVKAIKETLVQPVHKVTRAILVWLVIPEPGPKGTQELRGRKVIKVIPELRVIQERALRGILARRGQRVTQGHKAIRVPVCKATLVLRAVLGTLELKVIPGLGRRVIPAQQVIRELRGTRGTREIQEPRGIPG